MFTKPFLLGAAERGIKTFFQVFVAVVFLQVGEAAIGTTAGVEAVDWLGAASVSLLATFLSFATSIGNSEFTAGTKDIRDEPVYIHD